MRRRVNASFSAPSYFITRRHISILEGRFNYNEAFSAFKKSTSQKIETATVIGALSRKLQAHQSFRKGASLQVLDIGCADSTTTIQYLSKINEPYGFDYVGVDNNQVFLTNAIPYLAKEPSVRTYTLIQEDALSGKLSEHITLSLQLFDLIVVSHAAYYLKDELSGYLFIKDLLHLLTKGNGMAIFLHEDTTHHYRKTYNKQFTRKSTPLLLEQFSSRVIQNQEQFNALSFTSKLYFSPLSDSLWENAKYPCKYQILCT
jgi:hypothetical protein